MVEVFRLVVWFGVVEVHAYIRSRECIIIV
jgi:hypothetical protein